MTTLLAILCATVAFASGQEVNGTASAKLSSLPERFFQVQDQAGFLWQSLDNGALISGDNQYLQSGMNLILDGEPFAPKSGSVREPGAPGEKIDIRLLESRGDLEISRDLWFDTARSGVRILDQFTNRGKEVRSLSVVLRTTYPFAWQSLHGTGGRVLGTEPSLDLDLTDYSLSVHFSPSEGRHDTFFLFGSEKGGLRPEVKASANSRELIFTYSISIPAGQTRSLVHWILQRNLPEISQDRLAISPFIQRGQWIVPGLSGKERIEVVNLSNDAFVAETISSVQLRSMVALNALIDRVGSHRRGEGLLWLGPSSQFAGKIEAKGEIQLDAQVVGAVSFPGSDVAAVVGMGATQVAPLWYLRDGRVYSGTLTKGQLQWTPSAPPESPVEVIDPNQFYLLLSATDSKDGTAPTGTTHFVQLSNQTVLALAQEEKSEIAWATPWGRFNRLWSELIEWRRDRKSNHLGMGLFRSGSFHGALFSTETVSAVSTDGQRIELPVSMIERIWTSGVEPLLEATNGIDWIDFSEIPVGIGPDSGILLQGKQVLAGQLASHTFRVRDGQSVIPISAERILKFSRSAAPETSERFSIVLQGDERIEGEFLDAYLTFTTPEGTIELPMDRVLSLRTSPDT